MDILERALQVKRYEDPVFFVQVSECTASAQLEIRFDGLMLQKHGMWLLLVCATNSRMHLIDLDMSTKFTIKRVQNVMEHPVHANEQH